MSSISNRKNQFDAEDKFADGKDVMSKDKTKRSAKTAVYPDKTSGSVAARKLRSETNTLGDSARENLMEIGMQIIYGGQSKKTVSSRH